MTSKIIQYHGEEPTRFQYRVDKVKKKKRKKEVWKEKRGRVCARMVWLQLKISISNGQWHVERVNSIDVRHFQLTAPHLKGKEQAGTK